MWWVLLPGCATWISAAEQDERLADLGYVDEDGDGHPDVPDDSGDPGDDGAPHDWDDGDLVVVKIEEDLSSAGGGMNVDLLRDADDTLSRIVYCEAPGGEGEVNRIDDAQIEYAYDQAEPYATPVRGGRYPHGVPALLPWAPEWTADSGEVGYNLELVTDEAFDCWAIERFGTDRESGTLRLRVILSSSEWTEDDLDTSSFRSAMQKVDDAFSVVGLVIDWDVETVGDGCRNATLSSYDDAAALTGCAVDPGERELTMFLVDEIDASLVEPGDHSGLGFAPAVPFLGQGVLGATYVALDALQDEGDAGFGRDVAHAIGHALGLWELWEYDDNRGDPLQDTPDCTASVDDDWTACPSGAHDNVMYPEPTPSSGFAFTPDQGWVMRRAALVR